MSVSVVELPKFQFNQNNAPVAGGLLFTYAAGTSTPQTTYQDSAGDVPNTNPITLDANGQCLLYLTDGLAYKLTLSPAGDTTPPTNPYWTVDNVLSSASIINPVSVAQGGTGGTTVQGAQSNLGISPRATRIDVASVAGTVDLTANAPNTDDIRLTGALAVTKFTGVVGRVVRVFASGASTLTNNANIVTNTGANIVSNANDSYALRFTATNVCEVILYSRAIATASNVNSGTPGLVPDAAAVNAASAGYGTWVNRTASRALNTTYTNTSGRPMLVSVTTQATAVNASINLLVNGVVVAGSIQTGGANPISTVSAIVQPSATYSATIASGTLALTNWAELS